MLRAKRFVAPQIEAIAPATVMLMPKYEWKKSAPMLFMVSSMPKHMPYAIVISQALTFENPTSQHFVTLNRQRSQLQTCGNNTAEHIRQPFKDTQCGRNW